MAPHNDIVVFHYSFSPYARRIIWYLHLRGIDYAQCMQPPVLPRQDMSALGVRYRRIPIVSIGRNVYCDTRLILQKLEERFPSGALGATQTDQKALEKLLEKWTVDGGVFVRASQLIPLELPLMNDSKFTKDREDFGGRSWDKSAVAKMRPEALAHMRGFFSFLESTLLADGREWILKTQKPSLADIEAIWPFHWLIGLKGALPPPLFSKEQYPNLYAWTDRFDKEIAAAKSRMPKPTTMQGADAIKHITQADFSEPEGKVDDADPLGLKKGQDVEVWPIDSGSKHRDRGSLVALTQQEVVLSTQSKIGNREIRIHHPRTNFRIQAVGGGEGSKL